MSDRARELAAELIRAALVAADPEPAVRAALDRQGDRLRLSTSSWDLARVRRLLVVGAGKASPAMARGVEAVLGDRLTDGVVIAKAGLVDDPLPRQITVLEGGHPIPNGAGAAGAARLTELAASAGADDLLLCLISGGGSSLMTLPAEGLGLDDLQALTDLLLAAGATIQEINAIRKHLSRVAGGRLAEIAAPAPILSLVLSDVVGDPLDVIASGPTAPDPTTFADALAVLDRYHLRQRAPRRAVALLEAGAAGQRPETPKPGDPLFARVVHRMVGSNELAVLAAAQRARDLGLNCAVLSTSLVGEAREVGGVLAAILREESLHERPLPRPACLILGGETTVTLGPSPGRGGRNQELALAAALHLEGLPDVLLATAATDGNDGPTNAAGALVDGSTLTRARALSLPARAHLEAHDAYPFFDALGDLVRLGPTGTNVNDLTLLLAL